MNRLRQKGSFWVALVAAYMLVLQSAMGALALGIGPSQPALDAFGNPLCITGTERSDAGGKAGHGLLPDCCVPGCAMFAPASNPPEAASVATLPSLPGRISFAVERDISVPAPEHHPGNPRAPPLTA
ncbi:hypothetical protein [Aquamicrobium sp. LC103]|uniref:hypothetical protein n=1 Tax=Aquamicrobium sp. LC103 TaxID=1120658 RepID=UPI00063E701D|nr:hypothetical protein [Aquamicrobium sp. LC103]TKT82403.1 hypothetical protein XW59_000065 [Aquamicrobium sp. LC103]